MSRFTAVLEWILRLPLVWGGVACLAFYALLSQKIIDSPLLEQYCAGHNIEKIEVTVFFIGMAALVMRFCGLVAQFSSFSSVVLEPIPMERQSVDDCGRLLGQIQQLPDRIRQTNLARRLWDAIGYVRRTGSADTLDRQLRYLEEQEVIQIQSGYSMVRIIVWAIPILGLLGTVIGITMAVANLNPQALEESTAKVTAGLGVAFDHTATALALTMILMFAKVGVERLEDRLLAQVNTRVSAELVGRFQTTVVEQDPNVAAVRRMSAELLSAVESLSARQADVWSTAFERSNQQWVEVSTAAGQIVKNSLEDSLKEGFTTALAESIDQHSKVLSDSSAQTVSRLRDGLERLAELLVESLQRHGEVLSASEKELAEENHRHLSEVEAALGEAMVVAADRQEHLIKQSEHLLKEMQVALVEAAGSTVRQQEQLVKQGDILLQVVDATGQIKKLETTLNQNLATLRQGYHFEEMALNLSAAIQLLCARMGHLPTNAWAADVGGDDRASQAA